MFQTIANYTLREIIAEITIEDFINTMRSPDFIRKGQVDKAREYVKLYGNRDERYKKVKDSIPCIIFNFTHRGKINSETLLNPTGFLYIDFDNCDKFDFSKFPFIVAGWYSLSGTGIGILIKCSNLQKDTIKESIIQVCKILELDPDKNAISKDRCTVLGYDRDIYYNTNYSNLELLDIVENKKCSTSNIIKPFNRLQPSEHFLDTTLRFSNYSELTRDINFNGELFLDMGEAKLEYSEVVVPTVVKEGSRNQIMFSIVSQIYGLNNWMKEGSLLKWATVINKDKFHPPLNTQEIEKIVNNVFEKELPQIILNKTKRIIFNPDYKIEGIDRRKMATSYLNKKRGEYNTSLIIDCIDNWDFVLNGKVTQKKVSEVTGLSLSSIRRRFEKIQEILKIMNE